MKGHRAALHLLVKSFPNIPPSKFTHWLSSLTAGSPLEMAKIVAEHLEEDIFLSFLFEPEMKSEDRVPFLHKTLERA